MNLAAFTLALVRFCCVIFLFLRLFVSFILLKWEERLGAECVFSDQTVQFNFGVKDYGDLNRSSSKAYILFMDLVIAQFDFDINPSKRKKGNLQHYFFFFIWSILDTCRCVVNNSHPCFELSVHYVHWCSVRIVEAIDSCKDVTHRQVDTTLLIKVLQMD